jgi:drug/metabolite transporter (DMT)-like permease
VPAGTASIIVASAPLVSVAIAVLTLGERLTPIKLAGSALSLAGVGVVCLAHSGATLSSATLIVAGAAVVQGIYHPLTKPLLRTRSPLEVATYGQIAGAVMTLPLLPFGWSTLTSAPGSAWWAAAYLGLFPSALGFALWGYAVANLPVATSTSLLYLVPPVAVITSFIWLGERPYPQELIGGAVVIAGVVLIGQGDRLLPLPERCVDVRSRARCLCIPRRCRGTPGKSPARCGRSFRIRRSCAKIEARLILADHMAAA